MIQNQKSVWVGLLLVCIILSFFNVSVMAQGTSPGSDSKVLARLEQVKKMLQAATQTDASALLDAKAEIEELPYPQRGDRRTARRLNASALEKLKNEQFSVSLADFEAAWRADPSDQEISNNYGYALYRSNRFSDAEEKLRYTLALAPSRSTAWANLAEVLGASGKPQLSADSFVVSHRFSRNPETTRQYIEKFALTSESAGLKEGAARALSKLFPTLSANVTVQALAVTSTERRAMDIAEQNGKAASAVLQAAASSNDSSGKVPVALTEPMAMIRLRLPDPQILDIYRLASAGSGADREVLLRLAHGGNLRAQNAVGNLYSHGQGIETNQELGNSWYRKSAEGGFILAQFALAYNYHHGIGGAKNEALALEYYRRSAEQGHPYSMNNLAVMLERGQGSGRSDRQAAFDWYKKSAEAGLARGAFNTGHYLQYGSAGTADLPLAVAYFKSAANVGFAQAQLKVAQSFEYGWAGMADKSQAIDWYKKAALQGLDVAKDALKRLGITDF